MKNYLLGVLSLNEITNPYIKWIFRTLLTFLIVLFVLGEGILIYNLIFETI